MTKKDVHLTYSVILSAALVIAGLCLIVACVNIYHGVYQVGEDLFSRQAVAAAFFPIRIPVYLSLVLILGGIILNLFFPVEKKTRKMEKQYGVILDNLLKKADLAQCDPQLGHKILKLRANRKHMKLTTLALLAVGSIVFYLYALNRGNYPADVHAVNSFMIKATWLFAHCLLIPFGFGLFTTYYTRISMQLEIELVKQAIAAGCPAPNATSPASNTKNILMPAKCAVIAIALGLLLFGLLTGGTQDVLTKAVNICTECVGLG